MNPEKLAAIHALCFTSAPRPWSAAEFSGLIGSNGSVLVEGPDSFALGRLVGPEAEVLTLAVAPSQRRRGIAIRLLDALHSRLSKLGAQEIFLEVAEKNDPALALYEKVGYRQIGRRKGYYAVTGEPAVDAILLSRRL
ncbi:GNAT family N-acetyltransferase [Amaricoccus macauensis]|uniref:GNAT family N-acetyltransferase n=1 Tax=Amaricoccus macauensis TaxID=57001 RepID=UPI003C7AB443